MDDELYESEGLNVSELARKHCVPCEGGTPPMPREEGRKYLEKIPGWTLADDRIEKEFRFRRYLDGLEFAYSLGRTAEEEDHHPDMLVTWRRVKGDIDHACHQRPERKRFHNGGKGRGNLQEIRGLNSPPRSHCCLIESD